MSNPNFRDYFIEFEDFDFELSNRGGIDFKTVAEKFQQSKTEKFIIDISVNGYSNRDEFDFELNGERWSDKKKFFEKGTTAQKDPTALTVKRAIRLSAKSTSRYIKSRNIETNLKKYNKNCPSEFAHLGGHFVIDESNAPQLIALWANFDSNKNTNIKTTVVRVLELRFGKKF